MRLNHEAFLHLSKQFSELTPKARDVMILSILGLPSKEIAEKTQTSDNNIRHIRNRAFKKYGVKSLMELNVKITHPELFEYAKQIVNF